MDEDGLVAVHAATRDTDPSPGAQADARRSFHEAAEPTEDGLRIARAAADDHVAKLLHDHAHVTQLVNDSVAHRRDAFSEGRIVVGAQPLDESAIDTVLDDLLGTAAEWIGLLAGAEIHVRDHDANLRHLFVRALELFEPEAYVDAVLQRKARLGAWAPPAAYDAVERDVRATYVWPDAGH